MDSFPGPSILRKFSFLSSFLFFFFLKIKEKCGPFLKSLLNLLQYSFCFMLWCFGSKACGILAERRSLNPWTAGKVPPMCLQQLAFLGSVRHCLQPRLYINSFNLHDNLQSGFYYCPCFTDKKIEAQTGKGRTHIQQAAEMGFRLSQWDPKAHARFLMDLPWYKEGGCNSEDA